MNTSDIETSDYKTFLLNRIKFSLILFLQIPALVLSFVLFTFLKKNHQAKKAPQNYALLILLSVNFIQLSFTLPLNLNFYYHDNVTPATPAYCTGWVYLEFTLCSISEYLMATISVQRHMLVFNRYVLQIRRMRILLHHLPLYLSIIYPMTFYFFAVIMYPCDGTQWDYTSNICGPAVCYLVYDKVLGTLDWSINNGLPMVIIGLANIVLIVRVVKQKREQQRRLSWKKQRRLTLQLFCISSLYLVAWAPCLIVALVQILGYPTFLAQIQIDYLLFLISFIILFLPWIYLGLLPGLFVWIKTLCRHGPPQNTIGTIAQTQLITRTRVGIIH
ncbi:unnamed protein product [Rotaria sp. Silwood2]|nr:unnamed protein product [Rotaria sp. Silwood2]CAF2710103.1 unnamed protein product [Rotaria sp. Silwood2]CAF2959968.1 unnamed protein product [Rotaria sp. Silwood2]CAF3115833.1 unnamed protein product [Rotaria sp. Silwood2]CAF3966340.1 unnamed protein product [Rotaria sp. Silwood2]